MQEKFYVSIPVDTEGWTDEEKAAFVREVTIGAEIAAQNAYRMIMSERGSN